jgi:dTDP-4-amino-4,6-dideoxygalactose transaminase
MDPSNVERHVTSHTRAIIPVHLYGRLADMEQICAIAQRHGLAVIEDACQAHGARRGGRRAGSFGNAGCFSFYYSKNLGAYGEAGAVVTDEPAIAERVRQLRNHGSTERYHHGEFGVNSRIDEIQAAVLRIKLRQLDQWNARRRSIAAQYDLLLRDSGAHPLLAGDGEDHAYHLYVIRTNARDWLKQQLDACGIATAIHYPIPIHKQPAWFGSGLQHLSLPVTEAAAKEILSLPMYPELAETHVVHICDHIVQALSSAPQPVLAP